MAERQREIGEELLGHREVVRTCAGVSSAQESGATEFNEMSNTYILNRTRIPFLLSMKWRNRGTHSRKKTTVSGF